jgi:hypothetical protein
MNDTTDENQSVSVELVPVNQSVAVTVESLAQMRNVLVGFLAQNISLEDREMYGVYVAELERLLDSIPTGDVDPQQWMNDALYVSTYLVAAHAIRVGDAA